MEDKSTGEQLREKLFNEKENGWDKITEEEKKQIYDFCNGYMKFLNDSKTEREIVKNATQIAKDHGYKELNEYDELKPGDKIYFINRNKNLFLAVVGQENIAKGINIVGAHADSPRLDLKPNPLYEDNGLAYLKTHYYGGIKKYQWTTIPLSMHGVVSKTDGETIEINVGEKEEDPIFTITDLLPHLAKDQMQKKLKDGIEGENLDILIGSIPYKDDKVSEKIKLNILDILNRRYGIVEKDLLSAEIEMVPALRCRSLGFDESLIVGYGQDDKVCVYTALSAMMEVENPTKTAVCIFSDKEEIGSMGNTGMESHVFDTFISEILNKLNVNKPNLLDKVFCNSKMLSADVDAGFDPIYANVSEVNNSSFLNKGIGINKYTGVAGKAGGSDANAEYVAYIRGLFEMNNVTYQLGELGKIDEGGGGTIAYILANKGIEVLDCGVAVLSMHSPYEVTSKYDVYQAYKAYNAFLK